MKFFLDTADVTEVKKLSATGLIDGVTTNPSLIARTGRKFQDIIAEMCQAVSGPVSAEVAATDSETMIEEGRSLAKIAKNVAIKVPLTPDGLCACRALRDEGTMVNVTLCFSAAQALLAAKAGATFVSPFIGRLDDIGQDGLQLIQEIKLIYENYPELDTQILAASVRHSAHVLEIAKIGADIVTLPTKVLTQLFQHPLTDKGLDAFLKDWAKTGQNILAV